MCIFESDPDRRFYLDMVAEHAARYGLQVISWCLMSNHVHLIGIPDRESSLAGAMALSHRAYSSVFNARHGTKGFLFQGRFYSAPMDPPHFYAAVRYILRNPVRAGMVRDALSWPWSSACFHAGCRNDDPLVTSRERLDWIHHWEEYLGSDPTEIDSIRACTRTGRPCGGEEFIRMAESATGRKLRKEKPGRKPRSRVSPSLDPSDMSP